MENIAKISVWVTGVEELKTVLAATQVELECGSPKQDTDGKYIVVMYGPPAAAAKIAALGYKHEIEKNFGRILKKRQAQVGTGDRFQGGKVVPVGLGVKE